MREYSGLDWCDSGKCGEKCTDSGYIYFFFLKIFFLMWTIFFEIYLFIYGCVGSSFLCKGFL